MMMMITSLTREEGSTMGTFNDRSFWVPRAKSLSGAISQTEAFQNAHWREAKQKLDIAKLSELQTISAKYIHPN